MSGLTVTPMRNDLRIDDSPTGAGRGVFATRVFGEGEEIERCPMLIVDGERGQSLAHGAEGWSLHRR